MSTSKTKGFKIISISEYNPVLVRIILTNKLFEVVMIVPIAVIWVVENDLNPFCSTQDLNVGMHVQLPVG